MLIFQCLWFYLFWIFIPTGAGQLILGEKEGFKPQVYLAGLVFVFGLYEILGLVCSFIFATPLSLLTTIWAVAILSISILGWEKSIKRYCVNGRKTFVFQRKSGLNKQEKLLLLIIVLILALQVLRSMTGIVLNFDDTTYTGQANTSVFTDKINCVDPTTGRDVIPYKGYYYYALWPILWASMSQLTGVHPAIIMRTLLPLILIPCAYLASYLLLKQVFEKNTQKALCGLLLLELAYELMACNDGQIQWWLMLFSWYGKSIIPNMLCPFIIYMFLQIGAEQESKKRFRYWIVLAMSCWASCLISTTAFATVPFLLSVLGLGDLIKTKELAKCIKLLGCVVPNILLFVAVELLSIGPLG